HLRINGGIALEECITRLELVCTFGRRNREASRRERITQSEVGQRQAAQLKRKGRVSHVARVGKHQSRPVVRSFEQTAVRELREKMSHGRGRGCSLRFGSRGVPQNK